MAASKQIWLITYGASGQSITHTRLWSAGLFVDECYTATWRESKYTLIHLPRMARATAATVKEAIVKLDIVLSEIFGFGQIACNSKADSLESHPGFMHMVRLINTQPEELETWTASRAPLAKFRRGLLWKHIESTPPEEMTRTQLIKRAKRGDAMAKECVELEDRNALAAYQLHELAEEHTRLKRKLEDIDDELKQTREVAALHERIATLHEERSKTCQTYCEKLGAYTDKLHSHLHASLRHCRVLQAEVERLKQ